MCLHYLERRSNGLSKAVLERYKVFMISPEGDVQLPLFLLKGRRKVRTGVWLEAESHFTSRYNLRYRSGFHCFVNSDDAEKWGRNFVPMPKHSFMVFKIKVRGLLAVGSQSAPCEVYRYMKIIGKAQL